MQPTEEGKYPVRSTEGDLVHTVHFGSDEGSIPSCTSCSWERFHWPYRHVLCVFVHRAWMGWPCSTLHWDSPFFSLDTCNIGQLDCSSDNPASHLPAEVDCTRDEATISAATTVTTQARSCREVLSQLVECTYLCEDPEDLKQLRESLLDAHDQIAATIPNECGLLLHPCPSGFCALYSHL